MWGGRFFGRRYFGLRYWGVGAAPADTPGISFLLTVAGVVPEVTNELQAPLIENTRQSPYVEVHLEIQP